MAKSTIREKTFCQLLYLLDRKPAEEGLFYAPKQTIEPALQGDFPGLQDDVQLPFLIATEYNTAAVFRGFCVAVFRGFCTTLPP